MELCAYAREKDTAEYNVFFEGVLLIEKTKYVEIIHFDMPGTPLNNIPLTKWEEIVVTVLTHPEEALAQTGIFTGGKKYIQGGVKRFL